MYIITPKKIFFISFVILLLFSITIAQVYKLNSIQAINTFKDNLVNDAFHNYKSMIALQGVHISKDNPVNSTFPNPSNLIIKIAPPNKGVYQSAITNFGGTEDDVTAKKILDYEKMIGKKIVWAYFSNNWGPGIKFPEKPVKIIHSLGIVPFIRIMPRTTFTDGVQDPNFTLQRIIDGKFDSNLTKWAQDAKRVGIPIMAEFGTEVNGNWFPWSGILNGAGTTNKYGNSTFPDGPERFRDAYRHIIDLFRKEGVTNITWCFHVQPPTELDYDESLIKPWNNIKNYYPGDNYIDWIGISVYGSSEHGAQWISFTDMLDASYPKLAALSSKKPIAVFEFGVLEDQTKGNKNTWIQNALQSIENGRYPRIKAINYWNEKWNDCTILCIPGLNGMIDMTLNSSKASMDIYKKFISSPLFLTDAQYNYTKNN